MSQLGSVYTLKKPLRKSHASRLGTSTLLLPALPRLWGVPERVCSMFRRFQIEQIVIPIVVWPHHNDQLNGSKWKIRSQELHLNHLKYRVWCGLVFRCLSGLFCSDTAATCHHLQKAHPRQLEDPPRLQNVHSVIACYCMLLLINLSCHFTFLKGKCYTLWYTQFPWLSRPSLPFWPRALSVRLWTWVCLR